MSDIAAFLAAHPPFDDAGAALRERLAERARRESFAAGTTVIEQGENAQEVVRVVRSGAVALVDHGRVLDVLGEGELFGHPPGLEARAHEDLVCYALPAADVLPLLARTAGLRYLDLAQQPARTLAGEPPIVCAPDTPLREAAQRMADTRATSVLVRLAGGALGIVTDRDLRARVIAEGRPLDAPLADVMSSPAVTIGAERSGADVLMVMLDHGIRHLPVVTGRGEVVGVISDIDLLAAESRTPFALRRAIAAARDVEELRRAAGRLQPAVVGLRHAGLAPRQISALISVVADSLIRRTIELARTRGGAAPAEFAWLALGSHARREAVPSSDVDSGIVWPRRDERHETIADEVLGTLSTTGWRSDTHGLTAAGPLVARDADEWRRAIATWLADPGEDNAAIALSVVLDHRVVVGPDDAFGALAGLRAIRDRPHVLRRLLRLAVALRPPTGFLRNLVVEHSGEHRGTLDIKKGGVLPVVALARYAGQAAGATATSTSERLRAAGDAGVLSETQATTLDEAHEVFAALRLSHQATQLESGVAPDDHIDPRSLGPLARHHLRDAFRAVAAVQRNFERELHWTA